MACKASFDLYHNFPKVAEEAGFAFNTHRPRVHIEWNKIRLLDIENLIRERNFVLIEQHLNDILDCVLESEFDVRILDEGVVKIFRLAQLAVEYQQFCRHYLDRSVYVLREEIKSMAQELQASKRSLQEKEEENKRLKRKSRHNIQSSLPYSNENIATMILNTLKNQSDIFPSAPHLETLQSNKCDVCNKIFLNQFYLRSHLARRHPNAIEKAQRDEKDDKISEPIIHDNASLLMEVADLKSKLKEMESLIKEKQSNITAEEENKKEVENNSRIEKEKETVVKLMKDAEVLTQEQGNMVDKVHEWKEREFEMYKKELELLKNQIMHIVDEKTAVKNESHQEKDAQIIEKLHETIKQQGEQLVNLKQALVESQSSKGNADAERKRELEAQITNWAKKVELQSSECKSLLQQLNEMTKEVKEYKALANSEREKADQLRELLTKEDNKRKIYNKNIKNGTLKKSVSKNNKTSVDQVTLEQLQKKAQALLAMQQTSTSDVSSGSDESKNILEMKNIILSRSKKQEDRVVKKHFSDKANDNKGIHKVSVHIEKHEKPPVVTENIANKKKKAESKIIQRKENGQVSIPVSPIRVVRAKLTEEVNQRLVQLGVDPLKKRLPKSTFQKQRTILQKLQEVKLKKHPSREKIYHSIQARLDTNTTSTMHENTVDEESQNVSPNKGTKMFSISSVLSNVKTKALSFVKSNENIKSNNSYNYVSRTNTEEYLERPKQLKSNSPKDLRPSGLIESIELHKENNEIKNINKPVRYERKANAMNRRVQSSSETDSHDDEESKKSSDNSDKSLDEIVKPPIRKPKEMHKENFEINEHANRNNYTTQYAKSEQKDTFDKSSENVEFLLDEEPKKAFSEENINEKQTKGVLKNASSTSSLNKKKVLFDMDAIQMKSVSATPSLSQADKSDTSEKYALGIINLDVEEWDPSSIENESPKLPKPMTRTSPKIAELKEAIESQMSHRNHNPRRNLAGGIDILPVPMARTSIGGSNTSLGSSILDDSENVPIKRENQKITNVKQHTLIKSNNLPDNDESEIDFSELLADDKSDNKF